MGQIFGFPPLKSSRPLHKIILCRACKVGSPAAALAETTPTRFNPPSGVPQSFYTRFYPAPTLFFNTLLT